MGNKQCIFCKLATQQEQLINEDHEFFAFHDINKATASEHILVCTKRHLDNALQLKSQAELIRMRQFCIDTLNKLSDQKGVSQQMREYRFGFHLPPYNSIKHVHMHGFALPISGFMYRNFHYGYMLHSIQSILPKLPATDP